MVDAIQVTKITGVDLETTLDGIKTIRVNHSMNAPSTCNITLSNISGARTDIISRGDKVKVSAFPTTRTTSKTQTVFHGYVTNVDATPSDFIVTATDTLGRLGNEILLTNPSSISAQSDAADVIKEIVGGSSYNISLEEIIGRTNVRLSRGLDLTGRTRLAAVQYVLGQINVTPTRHRLFGTLHKEGIGVDRLAEVDDTTQNPYIAGRIPRTSAPLDFYPTMIDRVEDETDLINLVTVRNKSLNLTVSEPATAPSEPVQRLFDESSITDEAQARLFARQVLNQQGFSKLRWIVEGLPERFDIRPGDLMRFASVEGGLSGQHMIFDVSWSLSTDGASMRLEVGRQTPDFLSAIRFASSLST